MRDSFFVEAARSRDAVTAPDTRPRKEQIEEALHKATDRVVDGWAELIREELEPTNRFIAERMRELLGDEPKKEAAQ